MPSGDSPARAQRLLQPLAVVKPYAKHLTFLDDRTRTRRDHEKYLTLIDVIALLHRPQRILRTAQFGNETVRYIEATLQDVAAANRLAHEVLGRTLDELPPQTRRLLQLVVEMVNEQCAAQQLCRAQYRFSRRQVRERTRWGDTQLKIHLARLVELEYLLVHRGGRGQSFEYELLFDGPADSTGAHRSGLIDVEVLRSQCGAQHYNPQRSGLNAEWSESGRPSVGTSSAGSRSAEAPENSDKTSLEVESMTPAAKPNGTRGGAHTPSYLNPSLAAS